MFNSVHKDNITNKTILKQNITERSREVKAKHFRLTSINLGPKLDVDTLTNFKTPLKTNHPLTRQKPCIHFKLSKSLNIERNRKTSSLDDWFPLVLSEDLLQQLL